MSIEARILPRRRAVPMIGPNAVLKAVEVMEERLGHAETAAILADAQLARLPSVFLTPGMPVEAHVQIGTRSFWRYVTQPIRDSLHRAFTEQ